MAETTKDIEQKQDKIFRDLLIDLEGHLKSPLLFPSFKTQMNTYLSDTVLSTEDFYGLCKALERGGHIAPKKLKIFKDFTEKLDITANRKIVKAEKEIYRLQEGLLPMTMHIPDVKPPDQKPKLEQVVKDLVTQQLESIRSEESDYETKRQKIKQVDEDFKSLAQTLALYEIKIDHVEKKSLIFVFRYNSKSALKRMWELYKSGELLDMLENGIFTASIKQLCYVTTLRLEVYISEEEYKYCLKNTEEMPESKVEQDFDVPSDEDSKTASQASAKKRHSDPMQPQERSIQEEITDKDVKDVKDSDQKVISSSAIISTKHTVGAVSDVTQNAKATIQDFVNKTENTHLPVFYEAVKDVEDEIFRNESHYTNVIAKIKKQNEDLKLEHDKITNNMVSLCRECEKQNEDIIKNHKAELQSKIKELNARIKEMKDTLQTGTDTQIYEMYREIPNEVTIPDLPSLQDMDFNPTSILIDQLERGFGELTNNGNKARSYVDDLAIEKTYTAADEQISSDNRDNITDEDKKPRATLSISTYKTQEDAVVKFKLFRTFTYQCDIIRIKAILNINQVWVEDIDSELALLTNRGEVRKTIETEVGITDFCLSPSNGDIWFCNSIGSSVSKVTTDKKSRVKFHNDSKPISIYISADGNILVGMKQQIVKYTQSGQILCKSTQVKQVPVVRYPHSISQCPVTRNIAVLDWNYSDCGGDGKSHVSILNDDLQLLCRYYGRDMEQFDPWDLCYSHTGDIYIADYNNKSILQISGTGEFIQTVYTDSDKPAMRLCIQSNGDIWAVFDLAFVIILQKQ